MFKVGQVYERAKIHGLFGGERQKGISKPADHDFIMLFSGGAEKAAGSENCWLDGRHYQYLRVYKMFQPVLDDVFELDVDSPSVCADHRAAPSLRVMIRLS